MLQRGHSTKLRKLLLTVSLPVLLFIVVVTWVFATPGDLDLTFGTDGTVVTSINTNYSFWDSVAVGLQEDGKILLTGPAYDGEHYDFALLRFNSDGSPDGSFGTSGVITTPIGSDNDIPYDLVQQPDGSVIVVGYTTVDNGASSNIALTRYTSNGDLDSSFGGTGIITTSLSQNPDGALAVVLQDDGKILISGYAHNGSDNDFVLLRYQPNGLLDATFGSNGVVTTSILSKNESAFDLILQPNGKIILAGYTEDDDGFTSFAMTRYHSDGTLDDTFGTDGIVITDFDTGEGIGYDAHLMPDGKILLTGDIGFDFGIVRYLNDGSPDPTFGSSGLVTTTISNLDEAFALAVQTDGKILVAGTSAIYFSLARYLDNGDLDPTFGTMGIITASASVTNPAGFIFDLALQPDGGILAAGVAFIDSQSTPLALARYTGASPNHIPTNITLSQAIITESIEGAQVGMLSTIDVDIVDYYDYALLDDPSNLFEITGGILKLKAGQTADYDSVAQHTVTIKSTDSFGEAVTKTLLITVIRLEETVYLPVITAP